MEDLETNDELNITNSPVDIVSDDDFTQDLNNIDTSTVEDIQDVSTSNTTAMIEYKEVEEPCVALTIIGENRLTDAQVFIRRGFKFSFKAFFSTLVLTIMNMFI